MGLCHGHLAGFLADQPLKLVGLGPKLIALGENGLEFPRLFANLPVGFEDFGNGDGNELFALKEDLGMKRFQQFALARIVRSGNRLLHQPGEAIDTTEERFEEFRGGAGKGHGSIPGDQLGWSTRGPSVDVLGEGGLNVLCRIGDHVPYRRLDLFPGFHVSVERRGGEGDVLIGDRDGVFRGGEGMPLLVDGVGRLLKFSGYALTVHGQLGVSAFDRETRGIDGDIRVIDCDFGATHLQLDGIDA